MNPPTITPGKLAELSREGKQITLIDVRTPVEFREVHVEFARNLPLDELDPVKVRQLSIDAPGAPIYLVCQGGNRSKRACEKLMQAGLVNVFNVEGGTTACVASGLPVVRDQKAISLERQVRIAAGSLVLIGVLLGWYVHYGFLGLSAFVGAGLVFAGITNTCGMGMLLAKMPWNKCEC